MHSAFAFLPISISPSALRNGFDWKRKEYCSTRSLWNGPPLRLQNVPFQSYDKLLLFRRRTSCCADNGVEEVPKERLTEDQELEKLVNDLDAKPLRWSEIPFTSVQEELDAIDQYEREEELRDDDAWPKFLRGAAYEYWGQPKLALAQYALTDGAGGLRRVPELWERRAYNSFKVGNIGAANAYFEVSLDLLNESCGNELHFVHWFYDNFKDYVPKRNGPHPQMQLGICRYCIGQYKRARECFVPQVMLRSVDLEHCILWFLAACVKYSGTGLVAPGDLKVIQEVREAEYDWNPRMSLFIRLFVAAAEGLLTNVSEIETELSVAITTDDKDDITTYLYLALYHDAFSKDTAERDRLLDCVLALGGSAKPNDTENFLFFAAKNRLSSPPGSENVEVPEQTAG